MAYADGGYSVDLMQKFFDDLKVEEKDLYVLKMLRIIRFTTSQSLWSRSLSEYQCSSRRMSEHRKHEDKQPMLRSEIGAKGFAIK